jgi:glycosyltransferase involved in cell wall biosynthesis
MSLVSVIIPCFNSAAWLQETLDSVTAQTYPQLEVILVDDGSTDSTPDIIRQFEAASSLPVKTVFGPNHGAASARNTGLARAAGDYIQFLDADDLLLPEAIEQKVATLQNSDADVAYTDWQKLQEQHPGKFEQGECVTRSIEDVDPDPEIALFTTFWAPPVALLYTRGIVEKIGGWKQHLAPIEDARYMLDALFNGARFVHVPRTLALYRLFDGPSHSRRSPLKFVTAVFNNAQEVEAHWKAAGRLDEQHTKALVACYGYVARGLFRSSPTQFDQVLERLQGLRPGFDCTWPKVAGLLKKTLGVSMATALLALLGRPAGK